MKRKILFCEPCAYKEIIEESDINDEFESVPDVPGGAPKIDLKTKQVIIKKTVKRNKKGKCPKCGRGVFLKELPDVYKKTIKSIEKRESEEFQKQERQKRLKDGEPLKRSIELIKEKEAEDLKEKEREQKFKENE